MHPQDDYAEKKEVVVGSGRVIHDLLNRVEKVADSLAPVLIQGETGTGKSLLAKVVHENSSRNSGPFVVIDCGCTDGNNA